jgi:hypothetical protein
VEHPCQRCGSAVEDSSPFCPGCEAPQIRFSAREPYVNAVVVAPGAGTPPPIRVEDQFSFQQPAAGSDRSAALRAAMNAGVIAAVLSSLPLGPAFIFALPIAGFLCVLFYRRRSLAEEPSPGAGFRLGALTGLFGFAIFVVLTAVETLVFRAQNELRDAMIQAIRQAQARSADPQARQMLDYFMTPQGLVFMMVFGFIFMCIAFVLLSGIGGAISAGLLRRKGPPA